MLIHIPSGLNTAHERTGFSLYNIDINLLSITTPHSVTESVQCFLEQQNFTAADFCFRRRSEKASRIPAFGIQCSLFDEQPMIHKQHLHCGIYTYYPELLPTKRQILFET